MYMSAAQNRIEYLSRLPWNSVNQVTNIPQQFVCINGVIVRRGSAVFPTAQQNYTMSNYNKVHFLTTCSTLSFSQEIFRESGGTLIWFHGCNITSSRVLMLTLIVLQRHYFAKGRSINQVSNATIVLRKLH